MKRVVFTFLFIVIIPAFVFSQIINPMGMGQNPMGNSQRTVTDDSEEEEPYIEHNVKSWVLTDDFTFADTVIVDTLTTGFQIYNPIYPKSISNVNTGNLGAPYMSEIISDQKSYNRFIFFNSLLYYLPSTEDVDFYNTKTPYTNLFYSFGGPKRRSEESVGAMFTQNVNKNFNVGMKYALYSAIGHYNAQKTRNQLIRLFSSYTGNKYSIYTNFLISGIKQFENGGITNDDFILNPDKYQFDQPENIPVNFTTSTNKIKDFKVFINQSLGIGSIKIKQKKNNGGQESLSVADTSGLSGIKTDSTDTALNPPPETYEEEETASLPVSTIFYTFKYDYAKRVYFIDNLPQYMPPSVTDPYYRNIYVDSLQTNDSVRYNELINTFQIKFNEEANSLLKFGVRIFVSNAIRTYRMPAAPYYEPGDREYIPHYRSSDTTLTTSFLGGQIFKNLGKKFWWNANIKFFFQGYRIGDTEISGKINSRFKVLKKDTAGVFAEGGFYVTSPELFQNKYFSNHYQWNNDFRAEKKLQINGGIRIPTRRFEVSVDFRSITDHIYWNNDAMPDQASGFVQTIQLSLNKHFIWARVHSINKLAYQMTSNSDVIPLPEFVAYSSNYYENILFKVLTFQFGFDFRYHTNYYAPTYMPATGQFHTQNIRKTGNYPFFDLFLNLHLKRANFYVKLDHANQDFTGNNYFYTTGYPANPRSIKFGISWNFYN